jgi:CO/xanthine dehydrogenase Mo-binding subunit
VRVEDGTVSATGMDSRSIESVMESHGEAIAVVGRHGSTHSPPSYGVHFAEVEIDKRTGRADVTTYVAAQDVGFAMHPKMLEGQLEGAVLHSTEFALFSELKLDDGIPVNATIADYPAISPMEMPDELVCEFVESAEETGPYGAKGIGTPSMPPVAPALLNAIRRATGERFTAPPVESESLYYAVQGAE